ncbi:hypothetical protein [Kitasatospora sp. NPDC057500]|uniref:hypothetical protein n=1 Tax=Kitasatospora sp. NPDC057500 TaxID=3346151 RepID=UPI0036C1EDB9
MFAVHLNLLDVSTTPTGEAGAADVQGTLWARAVPGDGLEHVRARSVPGGVGLVLYVRAPHREAAELRAYALLDRALAEDPACRYTVAAPR